MAGFVRCVVDHQDSEFDYAVPDALAARIQVGSRLLVPFGPRTIGATAVELMEESDVPGMRYVRDVIVHEPVLTPVLVKLARWMEGYYGVSFQLVLRAMLPEVIRREKLPALQRQAVHLVKAPDADELEKIRRRSKRQAELLEMLIAKPGEAIPVAMVANEMKVPRESLRTLEKKGFVKIDEVTVTRDPHANEEFLPTSAIVLNPEQQVALDAILSGGAHPYLLQGVTGSGKTEVYLQGIESVLDQGKSALVLVPEISLTPQTVERFKSRFSSRDFTVAVLHSHLSDGERHDEWKKIQTGSARIVIGARSAVFAPLRDVGLIIVDEEHETSYKQEEAPRYQARDLAVVRARFEGCPVILGSATPSLESYHNAVKGKYRHLKLTLRVDDHSLPFIRIIDMRIEGQRLPGSVPILSERLRSSIQQRIDKGEQTIIFLNRRGFATSLICPDCGHVSGCPNCSVSLTYHRSTQRVVCHLCGYQAVAPKKCPECRAPEVRHSGYGTEKVEEVLVKVFSKARIARMDADTMQRKNSFRETLNQFKAGKFDILVGTQMIAKGLHFPNVTLVGIINADVGLHMPDFRSGERTFQLLTQVAGRAGRGEVSGEVFVQSHTPFHPSIQYARHHDVDGFLTQEMEMRDKGPWPPFTHMILITIRSAHQRLAEFATETLARRLKEGLPVGATLSEPAPAPIEKTKTYYRFHLTLRSRAIVKLSQWVRSTMEKLPMPEEVFVAVDVDPYQLL